jgi:hypothetical protein
MRSQALLRWSLGPQKADAQTRPSTQLSPGRTPIRIGYCTFRPSGGDRL